MSGREASATPGTETCGPEERGTAGAAKCETGETENYDADRPAVCDAGRTEVVP